VGLMSFATYEQASIELQPGDTLVLFTDGISEALNEAGDEFGEDRLMAIVKSTNHHSASALLSTALEEVRRFVGTARQHDDMTLVVLQVPAEKE